MNSSAIFFNVKFCPTLILACCQSIKFRLQPNLALPYLLLSWYYCLYKRSFEGVTVANSRKATKYSVITGPCRYLHSTFFFISPLFHYSSIIHKILETKFCDLWDVLINYLVRINSQLNIIEILTQWVLLTVGILTKQNILVL